MQFIYLTPYIYNSLLSAFFLTFSFSKLLFPNMEPVPHQKRRATLTPGTLSTHFSPLIKHFSSLLSFAAQPALLSSQSLFFCAFSLLS
jgi:hypothetical protein